MAGNRSAYVGLANAIRLRLVLQGCYGSIILKMSRRRANLTDCTRSNRILLTEIDQQLWATFSSRKKQRSDLGSAYLLLPLEIWAHSYM
jgi:hypothetical protein